MPILVAAQQKGGVGKTSAICNLACQAVAMGKTAAIIDMDVEQGSAFKWGERRKASGFPAIGVHSAKAAGLGAILTKLKEDGIDWIFIDLPGRDAPSSSAGLRVADLVMVPARPLEDDVEPSMVTAGLVRRGGGRYFYLMNIAPPQITKSRAVQVSEVLRKAGHLVSPVIITQRIEVPDANAAGLGVNEHASGGKSAVEYRNLFQWIEEQLQ
jgi:chromosome partitioning protein